MRTRSCACQGVRNAGFLENFAYAFSSLAEVYEICDLKVKVHIFCDDMYNHKVCIIVTFS